MEAVYDTLIVDAAYLMEAVYDKLVVDAAEADL